MYTITSKTGFKARVGQEESDLAIFNPRDWDNLGTMVCFHKRYELGDKHNWTVEEFINDLNEEIKHDRIIALPLFLYDHSGITMSTAPFSCPWDSGQVGSILTTREDIKRMFGWKRLTKKRRKKIIEILEQEVKTYDQYLTGDVWWYDIKDPNGEYVVICGGLFGFEYAKQEAESFLRHTIERTGPHFEQLQFEEV